MSKNIILLIVFFRLMLSTWFVKSHDSEEIKRSIMKIKKVHIDGYNSLPVVEKMPHYQKVGTYATVEMLVDLLRDDKENIIGLYGESGIGKSAILRDLHNKLESNALGFDKVIWVDVSTPVNILEIIDEIARRILPDYQNNIQWMRESQHGKSLHIYATLMDQKFLLLLDGIPDRIDLETIGVPNPTIEAHGSKVVFTCRSSFVCGLMEAQKFIEVKPLSFEDSWMLFCQNAACDVDNHSLDNPEICRLAKNICAQCRGRPKQLISIGRDMASATTMDEWKRCLETHFRE